jgi:hypothetical protein
MPRTRDPRRRPWLPRRGLAAALWFATAACLTGLHAWHALTASADALYDEDRTAWLGLADEVARSVDPPPTPADFWTGSDRFDGEWAVGTCQMALVGLAQVIDRFPDTRDRYLPAMRRCAHALTSDAAVAFGTEAWGPSDPGRGQAYLGYIAVGLAALLRHDPAPDPELANTHDALVARLARNAERDGILGLETYPGERCPPDQAVVIAALATHPDTASRARNHCDAFRRAIDPETDLLPQHDGGAARPGPVRGSGTLFASWWLAHAGGCGLDASRHLWRSSRTGLFETVLGFGGVREVPRGHAPAADIDSGPILFGYAVSATGFGLASAKTHRDREAFRALYRSSAVFGFAHPTPRGWRYAAGGSLGNAILLAAMTRPAAERADRPVIRIGRGAPPCCG